MHYADDVATGTDQPRKLAIAGRPLPGGRAVYVLCEEPEAPVLMHWSGRLVPHFKQNCPHCKDGTEEPKPLWYIGGIEMGMREPVIVEVTARCFRTLQAAAAWVAPVTDPATFTGLVVEVRRGQAPRSPRVLRCEQRVAVAAGAWPFRTREELARVWGVPLRPKLYQEDVG